VNRNIGVPPEESGFVCARLKFRLFELGIILHTTNVYRDAVSSRLIRGTISRAHEEEQRQTERHIHLSSAKQAARYAKFTRLGFGVLDAAICSICNVKTSRGSYRLLLSALTF
jgi:hypothetical protein